MASRTIRSCTRVRGFDDDEFDFQLLRSLGATSMGGATIGECLTAAARTRDGNPPSWVENFSAAGSLLWEEAMHCLESNHVVSARDLFFRSSMYYRAAEYFENLDSPNHDRLGLRSRDAFRDACRLVDPPVEVVEIPFEPFPLPGYFARPSGRKTRNKTLLALGGFDSSGEELYFQCAVEALKRGFNVLCFDGPGQTGVMRMNPKVPFRPDYEAVLKPVLDVLLSRDDVDPERVGLVGISFGGYLAPRSVAFELRIKALIVSSPVTDWSLYMAGFFGEDAEKEPDFTAEELLELPDSVVPPRAKQMTIHCFRKFGVNTWYTLLDKLKEFRLAPEMMEAITCPVLACIGEGEGDEPLRQCSEFTRFVGGPVTVHTFSVDWGADAHCQLNNLPRFGQVAYDWLNDVLR